MFTADVRVQVPPRPPKGHPFRMSFFLSFFVFGFELGLCVHTAEKRASFPDVRFCSLVQFCNGAADSVYSTVITQNLHDGVQVRGVGLAGDSQTDEGGDVCYGAGEGGGIGLVGLHARLVNTPTSSASF